MRLVHRDLFGQGTPIAEVLGYRVIDPYGDGHPIRVADCVTPSGAAACCYLDRLDVIA